MWKLSNVVINNTLTMGKYNNDMVEISRGGYNNLEEKENKEKIETNTYVGYT